MRKRRHPASEAEIDMTPMLDVVFIMLIFFIVTASFVNESGFGVPQSDGSNVDEPQDAESEAILLTITPQSDVFIFDADQGEMRLIDPRAVRPNVERLFAENPKRSVIIEPSEAAETGVLVQVIDQVRLSGAPMVVNEPQ